MPVVSASDVLDSLKAVKLGKAAGINGLSAEHFVCAHTSVSVHLSLLFTSMLSHGHIPGNIGLPLRFRSSDNFRKFSRSAESRQNS